MSVDVTCWVGLGAIGNADEESDDLVEGDRERSMLLVPVAIRRGGGGGTWDLLGKSFRGGRGGRLVTLSFSNCSGS